MKSKSNLSAIGGWNSFFFCIGMYLVALFFSIFVCSSIFYAVNSKSNTVKESYTEKTAGNAVLASINH